jgi:DNA-directed RNA polymerase specialized sigma24 family protein
MNTSKKTPYDFIQRHYRDPGGDDPVKRWLPHPENARAICAALHVNGIPEQDLEDAMQDVFVRALTALRKGTARVPADLREMKAFCAAIAKKFAMATLRKDARRERLGHAGICETDADEHTPLEYGAPVQRDPVDAGRQLEVAAQLFREGRMPAHGVDILEGVAAGCTYKEIGADLGISDRAVEGRVGTMRDLFRARMVRLGLVPGVDPLLQVVSLPGALEKLRQAA